MASAYFLNRSGWDVTVIDRGEIGHGCSYGNACLIVASHSKPIAAPGVIGQALRWMFEKDAPFYIRPRLDSSLIRWTWQFRRYCQAAAVERAFPVLLRLSRESLRLYDTLRSSGEADFFFERRGLLEVFLSDAGVDSAPHTREELEAAGFTVRLLSPGESQDLEPALSPRVRGSLLVEGEAHGSSYGYVRAMAETLEARGARLLPARPLARMLTTDGRIHGVVVDRPHEEIPADLVVLAAGSWSGDLASPLGIEIPLQPAKGYSCTIDAYPGSPRIPIWVKERRVIVTPLEGRLRFGGTLELSGFDTTINRVRYGAVVRAGREVLKNPPTMKNEEPWAGLRPVTPDGLPIIDRARSIHGLIVATGHAMLGFTQAPMTGKLVAELANGDEPSLPLAPFRLDRF